MLVIEHVAEALNASTERADTIVTALQGALQVHVGRYSWTQTEWIALQALQGPVSDDSAIRFATAWLRSVRPERRQEREAPMLL